MFLFENTSNILSIFVQIGVLLCGPCPDVVASEHNWLAVAVTIAYCSCKNIDGNTHMTKLVFHNHCCALVVPSYTTVLSNFLDCLAQCTTFEEWKKKQLKVDENSSPQTELQHNLPTSKWFQQQNVSYCTIGVLEAVCIYHSFLHLSSGRKRVVGKGPRWNRRKGFFFFGLTSSFVTMVLLKCCCDLVVLVGTWAKTEVDERDKSMPLTSSCLDIQGNLATNATCTNNALVS